MEKRELICIGCPMGCPLTVTLDGGAVVTVQGNTCPRGDAYARREVTAPTRIVTTTVRVTGGTLPAVSCKTRSDIPKEKIFDVVRALKSVVAPAPVHIGQILLPDAAGTGVDVVATKDVAEVEPCVGMVRARSKDAAIGAFRLAPAPSSQQFVCMGRRTPGIIVWQA